MSEGSDLSSSDFEGESNDASSYSSEDSDFIQAKKKQKTATPASRKASVPAPSKAAGTTSSRSKGLSPPAKAQSKASAVKTAVQASPAKGKTTASISATADNGATSIRSQAQPVARAVGGGKNEAPSVQAASATVAYTGGDITQGPPVASESAARKLILQYMMLQNRPYSAIQVFENLHQRISKPVVERTLNALCEDGGDLCVKEYGKAKIYFPDQRKLVTSFSYGDVDRLNIEIEVEERAVAELDESIRRLRGELGKLESEPSDADMQRVLEEIRDRIASKSARVNTVSTVIIDEGEKQLLIEEHNFYRSAWRSKKEKCINVVDMLAEGMEKSRNAVNALVGIETDEDASVQMPAIIQPKR